MILTNLPSTAKQRQEFALLVSIRFACVMNELQNPGTDPMNSTRVKARLAQLATYLHFNQPSKTFYDQFVNRVGELGNDYALKVSKEGDVTVFSNRLAHDLIRMNV
ncbi:hypothetical protein MJ923_07755 [Shewanella sp. 3B26]|uniref:Uncharacterized protein n=1 Tax=Shewanella zhuhaiensis TaxID=2919576 RepID=A0AAJ1F0A4_9GAMM|nr:hypothetical protein [Shewanella zhuhaiensis]MCH4294198.1 hypothetical protein [Shewanella zhuhaiensis]